MFYLKNQFGCLYKEFLQIQAVFKMQSPGFSHFSLLSPVSYNQTIPVFHPAAETT